MPRRPHGSNRPESPAAVALREHGAPTLERLGELAGISDASVSRSLAGLSPVDPRLVGVLRAVLGPAVAQEVLDLAEIARREHLARRVEEAS